jgi:two-component system, cell cycle sensor histidine kinase DivJ
VSGSESVWGLFAFFRSPLNDSARADSRLIVENTPDMLTRHDARGRVVFGSPAAERLFGEPAHSVTGEGLFERVHVADRPAYLTALSHAIVDDAQTAVEIRLRHSAPADAAAYIWVEMSFSPLPKSGSGAIAATRDISGRKAREAELVRARDETLSASRAKTQFLANISHELRTPLNAMIGFSEILNRELFGAIGEARYRDYARLIHESGEHLLNVVNDVLDLSKIEAGRFQIAKEPVDVAALVAVCCDIMRHAAEQRSLSLIVDMASDLPALAADKRACKQMLLNVIANAIKFTEPGGFVRVGARRESANIELSVADNGIGIAKHDLPKLGNPFVQANNGSDRGQGGSGLGLSVVSGLAQLHGGRLELASTLGEGTIATIILPLEGLGESGEAPPACSTVSAA